MSRSVNILNIHALDYLHHSPHYDISLNSYLPPSPLLNVLQHAVVHVPHISHNVILMHWIDVITTGVNCATEQWMLIEICSASGREISLPCGKMLPESNKLWRMNSLMAHHGHGSIFFQYATLLKYMGFLLSRGFSFSFCSADIE